MRYGGPTVTKFCKCALLALLISINLARAADDAGGAFITSNWRNEDGLPHSIINSVVQGNDGYLWIGTYVGLVRFDGVRFIHYTPAEIPELGDGRIVNLFVDRGGTLWIAIEGGRLVAYDQGRARIHIPGGGNDSQPIMSMAQDPSSTIWFQTTGGDFGKLTTNGVEVCARLGGSLQRSTRIVFSDQNGQVWVGTPDGLKMWHDGTLVTPDSWPAEIRGGVDSAAPCADGSNIAYRNHKLWRFKGTDAPTMIEPPPDGGMAINLMGDSAGRIWFGSGSGELDCRTPDGKWHPLPRNSLPGSSRVLCEDREGNIWRGSFGGGLARIRPRLFDMHSLVDLNNDTYARSAATDRAGTLWAIMNSDSIARVALGQNELQKLTFPPPLGYRTIFVDHNDTVWVAAVGSAVLFQLTGEKLNPIRSPKNQPEAVSAIYEDSHHNLWLGYLGGAGVGVMPDCDPKKWQDVEGIARPDVRAIIETSDGAMWFGTHYGGACRLKDGKWSQFTTRDGLPSDYVRCFLVDSETNFWIGTLHGLCRWRDGKFVAVTSQDGLWNDSLSYLAEDSNGNIWMSSFGGVFRVSRRMLNDFADGKRDSIQCVGYGRNDGLTSVECPGACQPAGAKTPDGRFWFPTVSGLASVSPVPIPENKSLPPVWIEELGIDGKVSRINHGVTSITVPPGKRRLDFRFTALSLSAPEKVQFRHKLTGLDLDWSPADARRTATYSYIPPGDYTFEVVACNNDGLWNENGHVLQLVIQPFFWQTWWFKSAVAALIILLVVVAVRQVERWRAQIQLERLEQKHAIEHERNRIAKDIHDDLGANLTQIVFLSQRAEGASHDQKEVEHWLQKIPATARRTIQSLDEIVWAINPKHDSLESLANYLSQFAQEHLTLAGIRCILEVPTVLPHVPLSAEVRHNLVLSVREALQNVVAHAAATEVTMTLQLDGESLRIILRDNGRGFDVAAAHGSGNGLANLRRRIEDIGGTFELSSQPGMGTTVKLTLPGKIAGA